MLVHLKFAIIRIAIHTDIRAVIHYPWLQWGNIIGISLLSRSGDRQCGADLVGHCLDFVGPSEHIVGACGNRRGIGSKNQDVCVGLAAKLVCNGFESGLGCKSF